MQDFRNLQVWHKAHQLTLRLYKMTRRLPYDERTGLSSQIRRAAASIGANIAEGCGRRGNPELNRFVIIAMGSASELEYHLLLAHDLGFIGDQEYSEIGSQISETKRMLASLSSRLRSSKLMN